MQHRTGELKVDTPVCQHGMESFALKLHVNIVKVINASTDNVKALSLVYAMKLGQPVEQLCLKPLNKHNQHISSLDGRSTIWLATPKQGN